MSNEGMNSGRDQAWPGGVRWELGLKGAHVSDVLWRCDALRAGRLYNSSLFGSRAEAEHFAAHMREVEPDKMFSVESVMANQVWN